MTPERWRRVEELFAEAKERRSEDLASFLLERCGNDTDLKREVLSLLEYHQSEVGVLSAESQPWNGLLRGFAGAPTLSAGATFGPYLIRALVGSGGMGEVYLAEDTRLHRKVALKLLPAWFNSEERLVSRFTQEALAASALNHPNVPVVYEAGEIGERHYISSEYVEGEPLTQRMGRGLIPWREAIALTLPVAEALKAAHAAGMIHRDVKPGNILVSNDGAIKLVDFGIAKLAEGVDLEARGRALTGTGAVLGTPGYMAPEQAAGLPVDARADIWSLAAVLHEMLTGKTPIAGSSKIAVSKNMPSPLAGVLECALQPDPEKRYSTVVAFAEGLKKAERTPRPRSRVAALLSALGVAAALTIGYISFQQRAPRTESNFKIGRIVKLTSSGNVRDAIISPDSRYVIYSVEESGKQSLRLRQVDAVADIERIPFASGEYLGLTFAPDGNYFYYTFDPHADVRYLYRASILPGAPRKIIDDIDSPVAVEGSGRRLAYVRGNTARGVIELHVARVDGSQDRVVTSNPLTRLFSAWGTAWSQDGKELFLAALDEHSKYFLFSVDAASGQRRALSAPDWDWVGRISLLNDGRTLIFPAITPESPTPELIHYSVRTNKWNALTSDLANYGHVYSGGSDIVAVQKNRLSAIWIATRQSPSSGQRITPPAGHYDEVVWSRDGTLLSNSEEGGHENLWHVGLDGSAEHLTEGQFGDVHPSVSTDGATIAFVSDRGGGWTIWKMSANGQAMQQLTDGKGIDQSPSFEPGGSILYGRRANGHDHIWKIDKTGGPPQQLLSMEARSPTVSPSGRYLACKAGDEQSGQSRVAIVDLQNLKILKVFPVVPVTSMVKWLPDETALTYIRDKDGVSNLWKISIKTGVEAPLTNFKEDEIFSFDWSPDGRNVALVRGIAASDVILIRQDR